MAGKPSLMEIKRQQWAREREEAQSDWCPWGRPGGGAPMKWHSDRNDARLGPAENKKDAGFLPPLNVYSHQHPPQAKPVTPTPAPLPLPPPPPPPRRSPRNFSQTDGETSGYHSDNHLVDPASQRHPARHRPEPLQPAVADHLQQLSTSRSFHVPPQTSVSDHHYLQLLPQGSLPIPPHTSVPEHYHHGHEHGHAGMPRADYKFLERRKWIQDGTVPYELYGESLPLGAQDRSAPPRWVARPQQQQCAAQGEPPLTDRTTRDPAIHHSPNANAAAPNFLRGQNVVLDAAAIAERESKRAKAAELQRILLQQLAEKENQKMLERKKQEEFERRQEEDLRRQIEIERRQIEEERRRNQEKKEAEERRMAAVREAIAGAQQNALADKAARKRAMQQHAHSTSISSSDPVTAPTTAVASDEMSSTTPVQKQRPPNRRIRTRSNSPESHRDHCRLVDTAVQTEQPFKQLCHCGNKSRSRQDVSLRIPATASERANGRPATQMSMIALKSQSSNNSNAQSRPRWNAHQTTAKYQSQTEKDPRFLNRRRDRVRRRQKQLFEKQLHGSWPSSENSGSQEDMGDTFFPVLPGSGAGEATRRERYYEAHKAAAVTCNQYKKPAPPPPRPHEKPVTNHHQQHHPHHKVESRLAVVEPPFKPPDAPVKQSRPTSPPVPAVLKKMQMLSGEKHEWENEQPPETGRDSKMEKELENQHIKEQHAPCTEDEKEDLLFRLSLLKKGLEKMRADLDAVSLTSSN